MAVREHYRRGLHELSDGVWAWLQPDGSWGLSNAGLLTDGEASMLVAEQAASDISLAEFRHWKDAERVAVNVRTIYRQLSGNAASEDVMELFAMMAELSRAMPPDP